MAETTPNTTQDTLTTDATEATTGLADAAKNIADSVKEGDFKELGEQSLAIFLEFAPRLLQLVLVLVAAWIVAGWLRKVVTKAATRAHIEITLAKFFGNIARWAVLIVAGIMVLGIFGVETASLAASLAAVGFAIGLALQGTMSNIASGIMLLILRPFRVGDVIKVGDVSGRVEEVELFTTAVDTFDNRRIIVPNSTIFGAVIENFTKHDSRRVDVTVGAAYSADIDETRQALMAAAKTVPGRDESKDPVVVLTGLGASSVDWVVRIWCPTAVYWDVKDAAIRAAKRALDEAGISIPFPQMDLHIHRWPGPPSAT